MFCQRCKGLLVCETYGELLEGSSRQRPATRCLNCGCIEDAVIRANRLNPPVARRAPRHRVGGKGKALFIKPRYETYGPLR